MITSHSVGNLGFKALSYGLLALVLGVASARADELSITPSADTTLYEQGAVSNGKGKYMFVGITRSGQRRRALVRFDLARALPAGTVITNVTLGLHVSRTVTVEVPVAVHRVNAAWNEGNTVARGLEGGGSPASAGDATWMKRVYDTIGWQAPGGDFSPETHATTIVGGEGIYNFSSAALTQDAQDWLEHPERNFGWILLAEGSDGITSKRFDSRDTIGPTRPVLTITYATPSYPVGACCDGEGGCGVRGAAASCEGTFRGLATSCQPNPCPPPTGACCQTSGSVACTVNSQADCESQHGMWQGPHVACEPILCPVALTPFVDPLPRPIAATPVKQVAGVNHYRISMVQTKQKLHRDLPATTVWAYSDGTFTGYPGPTIEAEVDKTVKVTWVNDLRDEQGNLRKHHILPVESCLPGAETDAPRTVVHLHGAHVPPESDGRPDRPILPGEQTTYEYPNHQGATTLWYHDHAMGITRLNVYMGLAGFYLLRDPQEEKLTLPSGEFEIPLVVQDRSFAPDGSLLYPQRWEEHFFGNSVLVNGKVWPYLEVKRGLYRFRMLNGSTSRTYTFFLSWGDPLIVIGGDGGLLPAPVTLNRLTLAPGERADVVIDFSRHDPGQNVLLQNDAPTPFPNGGEDHLVPQVMQFRVTSELGYNQPLPATLRPRPQLLESSARVSRDFKLDKSTSDCGGSVWRINGKTFDDITERPVLGSTEIWRFINRSGELHSMHMHLVMFQVLDRQSIQVNGDNEVPTGQPTPPNPEESGWKDTVKVGPFETARVIARFTDYAGLYPYHCHILEHEDQEMMRQFETVAPEDAGTGNADDAGTPSSDAGAPDSQQRGDGGAEPHGQAAHGCGCRALPAPDRFSFGWLMWSAAWLGFRAWRRRTRGA